MTSKVLAILGAFDADHCELTLTELAHRAGLTLSTAHANNEVQERLVFTVSR